MKRLSFLVLLLAFLAVGCAHRPSTVSSFSSAGSFQAQLVMVPSDSAQITLESPEISVESGDGSSDSKENLEAEEGEEEEIATIADPLEPFNRAMFHFNDKLYFWVLKPVAQGYNKVVPEAPRVSVHNFFLQSQHSRSVSSAACSRLDFSGAGHGTWTFRCELPFGESGDFWILHRASRLQRPERRQRILAKPWESMDWDRAFYIDLADTRALQRAGFTGVSSVTYFLYPVEPILLAWYVCLAVSVTRRSMIPP